MKISTMSQAHSPTLISSEMGSIKANRSLVEHRQDSLEDSGKSKGCFSPIKNFFSFILDKIGAFFNLITCNICSSKGPDSKDQFSIEVKKIVNGKDEVFSFKSADKEFKIGNLKYVDGGMRTWGKYTFETCLNENELDDLIDKGIANQLVKKILESLEAGTRTIIVTFDEKLGSLIDESLVEDMKKEVKETETFKSVIITWMPKKK